MSNINTLNKYVDEIGLEVETSHMEKAAKNVLSVGELIKQLERYNPELPVILNVADNIVEAEDSCVDANVSEGPLLDSGTYIDEQSENKDDYIVVLSSCGWSDMHEANKLFPEIDA